MSASPLSTAHRAIRSIAPPDVPVAGVLSTFGEDTALFVAVDDVDPRLWLCDDPQHVWAPVDVVRHSGGADAVLAWCSEPLVRLLDARRDEPLHGGEAVTLAVSLLRGAREALTAWSPGGESVTGRWWVSEAGKPLFVLGDGGELRAVSARALALVAARCADSLVAAGVVRAQELLEAPGRLRPSDDIERALFHLSAPRPVVAPVDPSARASVLTHDALGAMSARGMAAVTADHRREEAAVGVHAVVRSLRDLLATVRARLLSRGSPSANDAAVKRTSHASASSREGDRGAASPGRRRRTVVVMGVVMVAVATVAALTFLPGADADVTAAAGASEAATKMAEATVAPDVSTPTAPAVSESVRTENPASESEAPLDMTAADLVGAATALLAAARACSDSGGDCADVVASPDVLARVPAEGPVALIDDYGGMAVVGVGEPAVYVLLEKRDDRWIIRSVPDAATG